MKRGEAKYGGRAAVQQEADDRVLDARVETLRARFGGVVRRARGSSIERNRRVTCINVAVSPDFSYHVRRVEVLGPDGEWRPTDASGVIVRDLEQTAGRQTVRATPCTSADG